MVNANRQIEIEKEPEGKKVKKADRIKAKDLKLDMKKVLAALNNAIDKTLNSYYSDLAEDSEARFQAEELADHIEGDSNVMYHIYKAVEKAVKEKKISYCD